MMLMWTTSVLEYNRMEYDIVEELYRYGDNKDIT